MKFQISAASLAALQNRWANRENNTWRADIIRMQRAVAIESIVGQNLSDFIVDLNQGHREVRQSATTLGYK